MTRFSQDVLHIWTLCEPCGLHQEPYPTHEEEDASGSDKLTKPATPVPQPPDPAEESESMHQIVAIPSAPSAQCDEQHTEDSARGDTSSVSVPGCDQLGPHDQLYDGDIERLEEDLGWSVFSKFCLASPD